MHFNHIILGLLFAATTWAREHRSFFTLNNGKPERLSVTFTRNYGLLISNQAGFHEVQMFNFKDGVASFGKGKNKQFFGLANGICAIGYRDHVEPVKLQLDDNNRITNLQLEMCVFPFEKYLRMDHKGPCVQDLKCSPKDIFFLTIDEAEELTNKWEVQSKLGGRWNDNNQGIKKPTRISSKDHEVSVGFNIFIQANESRSSIGDCDEGALMTNIE